MATRPCWWRSTGPTAPARPGSPTSSPRPSRRDGRRWCGRRSTTSTTHASTGTTSGGTGETVWTRSFDYRALRRHLLDPWLRRRRVVVPAVAGTTWPPTPSSTTAHGRCRSRACSSSTVSSPSARSCGRAGTSWSGWTYRDQVRVRGWPAATAYLPTLRTRTSAATSTPSASTATPRIPSAPPTSSSTTPTRRALPGHRRRAARLAPRRRPGRADARPTRHRTRRQPPAGRGGLTRVGLRPVRGPVA